MDDIIVETVANLLKRARLTSDLDEDETRLWRDIVLCIAVQLRGQSAAFDTDEFLAATGWGRRCEA